MSDAGLTRKMEPFTGTPDLPTKFERKFEAGIVVGDGACAWEIRIYPSGRMERIVRYRQFRGPCGRTYEEGSLEGLPEDFLHRNFPYFAVTRGTVRITSMPK